MGVLEAAREFEAVTQHPVNSNVKSPQQPNERAPASRAHDIAEKQHGGRDVGMRQVIADSSSAVVYQVSRG
jgi:hypothetical protein